MSKPIFERYVDERGNISVRVSQDMIVLTQEEAERIEAKYKRMQAENAKLREELADAPKCETCEAMLDCDECLRADGSHKERRGLKAENDKLRELVSNCHGWLAVNCEKGYVIPRNGLDAIEQSMRELGVDTGDAID